jgi:aminotransferase
VINVFQPHMGHRELRAVREVFATSWLGPGRQLEALERTFADFIGARRREVLSISSCTEGLFQAMAALGLGVEDEVILPSISFVGAAHAVRACGARVVLCDVEPRTLMPTTEHIRQVLTARSKVILLLHYGGHPGCIRAIVDLAHSHSLTVVEDAACGLGSSDEGIACGMFGDIGIWSFDPMKIVACGNGGMVRARRPEVIARIRQCVSLGVGSAGLGRSVDSERWWEIDPIGVGRRGRMDDVAAAVCRVQLSRFPAFRRRRAQIAAVYDASFVDLKWVLRPPPHPRTATRHFYWIQLAAPLRDQLARHLLTQNIYTTFRYWPLHRTAMYGTPRHFPGADEAAASTLLLPLHQGLSSPEVMRVVEAVSRFSP